MQSLTVASRQPEEPGETAAAADAAATHEGVKAAAVAGLMEPRDLMAPLGPSADEGRLHARLSALRVALRRAESALQDKVRLTGFAPSLTLSQKTLVWFDTKNDKAIPL